MESPSLEVELKPLEITEICQRPQELVVDLSSLEGVLAAGVECCALALRAQFNLESTLVQEPTVQQTAHEAGQTCLGMMGAVYFMPALKMRAVVGFQPVVLFRVLDAMYGGDGQKVRDVPGRALSGLETAVADQLARTILGQFQAQLSVPANSDCALERFTHSLDVGDFGEAGDAFVCVRMLLEAYGERMFVALPVRALELVRDRVTATHEDQSDPMDPQWREALADSVGRTEIELLAVASGPDMLLADVAALRPGALVAFDAAELGRVRIESGGEAIFEGQLGQQKGYFSICLETPLAAPREQSQTTPRRRA